MSSLVWKKVGYISTPAGAPNLAVVCLEDGCFLEVTTTICTGVTTVQPNIRFSLCLPWHRQLHATSNLAYWGSMDLRAGTDEAKQVAFASFGWKASVDGPWRIFGSASLWPMALKNRLSFWMVELTVFLKNNEAFLPTTEQVFTMIARRRWPGVPPGPRPAPPPRPRPLRPLR